MSKMFLQFIVHWDVYLIVRYLTPVSDLDLAPPLINLWLLHQLDTQKGVLGWLKFDRGGVQETQKLEPLQKLDN